MKGRMDVWTIVKMMKTEIKKKKTFLSLSNKFWGIVQSNDFKTVCLIKIGFLKNCIREYYKWVPLNFPHLKPTSKEAVNSRLSSVLVKVISENQEHFTVDNTYTTELCYCFSLIIGLFKGLRVSKTC